VHAPQRLLELDRRRAKRVVRSLERLAKIPDSGVGRDSHRARDNVSKVEIIEPIVERELVALGVAGDGIPAGDDSAQSFAPNAGRHATVGEILIDRILVSHSANLRRIQ
jgi:hypothetical protein